MTGVDWMNVQAQHATVVADVDEQRNDSASTPVLAGQWSGDLVIFSIKSSSLGAENWIRRAVVDDHSGKRGAARRC